MNTKVTGQLEEIKAYYKQRATVDHYATSPDRHLREIEIEYIGRRLADGLRVLDIGCGNGYSTLCHAAKHNAHFVGGDFVPEMVQAAERLRDSFTLKGRVDFQVADVTHIEHPDASFDAVISQRCLLNLPSRPAQWQAMSEIARVLKPGGRYLMLEGTLQGLRRLNQVRTQFALDEIPEADQKYNSFSNKFDEPEMLAKANEYFTAFEGVQRFGMYYLISRVIHPLLAAPAAPRYDAPINEIARQLCSHFPNFEDMGHVALFTFLK